MAIDRSAAFRNWLPKTKVSGDHFHLVKRGKTKLSENFTVGDPTQKIGAAWGVKEQLRRVLPCTTLTATRAERVRFSQHVAQAAMPETNRLKKTIDA